VLSAIAAGSNGFRRDLGYGLITGLLHNLAEDVLALTACRQR
jgi:hypothetical protein